MLCVGEGDTVGFSHDVRHSTFGTVRSARSFDCIIEVESGARFEVHFRHTPLNDLILPNGSTVGFFGSHHICE